MFGCSYLHGVLEINMILRLLLLVLFSVHCCSCSAEIDSANSDASLELSVMSLSSAVSEGNVSKFKGITSSEEMYLVRKFTSGNFGGRGAELSDKFASSAITNDMEFLISGQTPFNLKMLFPGFPVKNYKKIPQYTFPTEACHLNFDQWGAALKKAIQPLPEAVEGNAIILKAATECWVYAEAQVIDGILVGGFAVFKKKAERLRLVSIIKLL
jgi:hypothetical protein